MQLFSLALTWEKHSLSLSLHSCFPPNVKKEIHFPLVSSQTTSWVNDLFSSLFYCRWNATFLILNMNEYTLLVIVVVKKGQKRNGKSGYHFTNKCISQLWRPIYTLS